MKKALALIFLSFFAVMSAFTQGAGEGDEKRAEPEFREVPSSYLRNGKNGGTVERVNYLINYHGSSCAKHAYVYLPYGYESKGARRYNIFYLMHGGSGSAETFFGGTGRSSSLKNMLDNMIEKGDIDPMIVVTPSYYNQDSSDDALLVSEFHDELDAVLIPAVESRYRTYGSREHRAFGGFSMGSVTTWYTYIYNLDSFKYFMPMSADSWVIETMGGRTQTQRTAEYLSRVPKESGYNSNDFFIFAATGTADMAYENETLQIEAMKKIDDIFFYGWDPEKDNLYYMVAEGGRHTYDAMNDYIFNALPYFFGEGNE